MRFILLITLLFFSGCSSYKIPIQTENHPASPDIAVYDIHLSPVLEIPDHACD